MDRITTFLNSDLNEQVYMQQPEGFHNGNDENLVC